MSTQKRRQSCLRPLTQIAPSDAMRPAYTDPVGTVMRALTAHSSESPESQVQSHTAESSDAPKPLVRSRVSISLPSSRASSFADEYGHSHMSDLAVHPSSIPSQGNMPHAGPEPARAAEPDDIPEEAFLTPFQLLWESGVDKITSDFWASLVEGWKSGDIASPRPNFFG